MSQTPHFPIYMDYGATTPVDPRVVDAMIPWLREHFGNPASRSHAWGWEAEEAVETARGHVAALIGADVVTAPPFAIKALVRHPLTDSGLAQFLADWAKTGQSIG